MSKPKFILSIPPVKKLALSGLQVLIDHCKMETNKRVEETVWGCVFTKHREGKIASYVGWGVFNVMRGEYVARCACRRTLIGNKLKCRLDRALNENEIIVREEVRVKPINVPWLDVTLKKVLRLEYDTNDPAVARHESEMWDDVIKSTRVWLVTHEYTAFDPNANGWKYEPCGKAVLETYMSIIDGSPWGHAINFITFLKPTVIKVMCALDEYKEDNKVTYCEQLSDTRHILYWLTGDVVPAPPHNYYLVIVWGQEVPWLSVVFKLAPHRAQKIIDELDNALQL